MSVPVEKAALLPLQILHHLLPHSKEVRAIHAHFQSIVDIAFIDVSSHLYDQIVDTGSDEFDLSVNPALDGLQQVPQGRIIHCKYEKQS